MVHISYVQRSAQSLIEEMSLLSKVLDVSPSLLYIENLQDQRRYYIKMLLDKNWKKYLAGLF